MDKNKIKISIVGLGYVGLPLAVEFGKKYETVGYDIDEARVQELIVGNDKTLEVDSEELIKLLKRENFKISSSIDEIKDSNVYIITVPTPVDEYHQPILTPLLKASEMVGKIIQPNDVVIYESTVYPGLTEEICVPILESKSKSIFNKDFFVGYSPERINPGDKTHTLTKIKKVTSGSTEKIADFVDKLYGSIIDAGTFKASSIKVAEAAKVIENSQRDINIAFINELAKIFSLMDIDTNDVLKAASSKWNFLNFKPGLVGGHCIGVDPYYLATKAQKLGYNPEIILAGRRINDSMGKYVASRVIKLMINKNFSISKSQVLVLGITFKENCPDFRNTKVVDMINELKDYGLEITIVDPWVNSDSLNKEYGLNVLKNIPKKVQYEAVVLAVGHNQFKDLNLDKLKVKNGICYDIKGFFEKNQVSSRL
tara:strand:- start:3243 stop:4520 length:1278 start_codon:yes stop_codon:yes gene_type:complete